MMYRALLILSALTLSACGDQNTTEGGSSSSISSSSQSSSIASSSPPSSSAGSSSIAISSSSSPMSSSSSSASSGTGTSGCDNGALFCEDFEQLELGAGPPNGIGVQTCPGNSAAYTVVAENGGKALSIETKASDAACAGWVIAPHTDHLASAYVRFDAKVEDRGGNLRWFMLLENTEQRGGDYDTNGTRLRLPQDGGWKDYLIWNRAAAGDTVAPDVYSGGAQLASSVRFNYDQWACYELFYDENGDLITLSINGTVVPGLTLDNDRNTGFDQRWLDSHGGSYPVRLDGIRIGFGGSAGTTYIDNLVVSEFPIGCQ